MDREPQRIDTIIVSLNGKTTVEMKPEDVEMALRRTGMVAFPHPHGKTFIRAEHVVALFPFPAY